MIGTVLWVSLIGLARDRVALALTFVMPVAFFSIRMILFAGDLAVRAWGFRPGARAAGNEEST